MIGDDFSYPVITSLAKCSMRFMNKQYRLETVSTCVRQAARMLATQRDFKINHIEVSTIFKYVVACLWFKHGLHQDSQRGSLFPAAALSGPARAGTYCCNGCGDA